MGAVSARWALLIVGVAAATGIAAVIVYMRTAAESWLRAAVPACVGSGLMLFAIARICRWPPRIRQSLLQCMSFLLCRFSDAGSTDLTTRSVGRRPKSAKARLYNPANFEWSRIVHRGPLIALFAALHESACSRYCCKSLFALVIKNSLGCRRDFRVKMWGDLIT
jgi:hypothetical protein